MIRAVVRAMVLSLLRDRGALIMTFLLPPLLFLVFAAVFTGASGDRAHITVALAKPSEAPAAAELAQVLKLAPETTVREVATEAVDSLVAHGTVDVGLIIQGDPAAADSRAPVLLVVDPARAVAAALLTARIQRLMVDELPAVAIRRVAGQVQILTGPFSEAQKAKLDLSLARAKELVAEGAPELIGRREVAAHRPQSGVTYYAGAIAILFLMFAAVQGAASLVDERRSGVFDRILMAPGGLGALVAGKFLFLILQGLAQASVLFAVASLVHGVPVLPVFGKWLAVTLCAAAASAGLALTLAAAARTRQQAQTISTFAVLLLSAVGGSMVPRFLMPDWLQSLAWITPTAWTIEAYQGALWRADAWATLTPALLVLLLYALIGVVATFVLVHRHVKIA